MCPTISKFEQSRCFIFLELLSLLISITIRLRGFVKILDIFRTEQLVKQKQRERLQVTFELLVKRYQEIFENECKGREKSCGSWPS